MQYLLNPVLYHVKNCCSIVFCAFGALFTHALREAISCLAGRKRVFRAAHGDAFFAARSSFSPAAKVKRKRISAPRASLRSVALRNAPAGAAAGVEEKEGLPHSACSALPTGAVRLFVKRCFSCGLRPKGAAAGKNYAPNVRHLSEQNLCVYAKAMLSRSKAALSAKGYNSFEFLLWRAFCMRIYSLSAAAPLARQYLLHPLSGGSVDVSANLKAVTAVQSCVSIVWHLSGQNNICCTRQRQRR